MAGCRPLSDPKSSALFSAASLGEEVWTGTHVTVVNRQQEREGEVRRTDAGYFSFKNKMSWKTFGLIQAEERVILTLKCSSQGIQGSRTKPICNLQRASLEGIRKRPCPFRESEKLTDKSQWKLNIKYLWTHSRQVTSLVFTFTLLLPTFDESLERMADKSF